jgi:predicted PurR-regulated permease PerM
MVISRDLERYAATAALVLLVIACYLVLRPFLTAFVWGGIIAVSTRGIYVRLVELFRGRRGVAAAVIAVGLAAVLLVPLTVLGLQLTSQVPGLRDQVIAYFADGFPPPPGWLQEIPLMGARIAEHWQAIAADPERIASDLRPLFAPVRAFVVDFSAGIGAGVLEFVLALLMASLLHLWGDDVSALVDQVMLRLGGEAGRRQRAVVASTVRGVFNGVIGTAAAQSLLAMIGYWIAGVPGVVLLGMGTFLLSVVPGGPAALWLPAAIWLYLQSTPGWALFMLLWGFVVVSGSDNIIRPLLIGQGVSAPLGLIFLGVIGGILAFGFLGLFIGPTVLAVAFNLFQDWISTQATIAAKPAEPTQEPPR